ncbi:MAG: tetratricopeptide repeat protein [Gammaproteobacteria bacterium]|nr:tetratricopeptide repeat protein [Gammaproteobacteria bacterium]NIW87061.1 tetratricopeptide repeat protein [Gammaproteobacteria bacterium]
MDPNYGDAYVILALSRTYGGHADEATTLVEKALRLNPHPPSGYYLARGRALFFAGRLTEAVSVLNKALEINPNWQVAHVYLAAAYAELDRQEDAQWEADQILVAEPDFTIDRFERTAGELIRQKRDLDALLSGLRKAGLPE